MKERPILFSGPMVRAILDGRKTQTRRIAKEFIDNELSSAMMKAWPKQNGCKYGNVGDRLWVRETFAPVSTFDPSPETGALYRADRMYDGAEVEWKWKPSIFMPRWASRITLDITGVRVERLNSISESDAKAEGIEQAGIVCGTKIPSYRMYGRMHELGQQTQYPIWAYESLWNSINGSESWAANPFVWVVEFKRVDQ